MAFYLAQVSGLLDGAFPWSMNSVLSSSSDEATVSAAWNTAIRGIWTNATFKLYIPVLVTIEETSVSTASATFKQTTKTTVVGTTAGDAGAAIALPFRTCEIVTFRTPSATKWGRGRWYFPPLASTALGASGFEMLAAAQTAMQGAMDAYFTSVGTTYEHVILHRHATAGGARTAYSTDPVVACDIPNTFATQKRRADKIVSARLSVTV